MWRQRKTYETPSHPWQAYRLEEEEKLMKEYGLKNKKELWKAVAILRKIRYYVRKLNAKKAAGFDISEEEKKFKNRLVKYGLLSPQSDIMEALNISVREILERRLQTIVYRKGLAKTIKEARQLIVHRHIMVGEKVISSPSYLVTIEEEKDVKYNSYSKISKRLSQNSTQQPSQ